MYRLAPTETHLIKSDYVGDVFKISVMQPLAREAAASPLPVIYATDANSNFETFRGLAWSMQLSGDVAPFILVGIGYDGEALSAGLRLRARDLTFPGYPKLAVDPAIEGVLAPEPGTPAYEGADRFLDFLNEELIPRIDALCPTKAGARVLFGHSVGAGFGLYALLSRTGLFSDYIVSSPGVQYDGETSAGVTYKDYDFLLARVARALKDNHSFQDARVYTSVGAEEEFEPDLRNWRLTSSHYRLCALLRQARDLSLVHDVFVGHTHMTAWPIAFMNGVRTLLGSASAREAVWRKRDTEP